MRQRGPSARFQLDFRVAKLAESFGLSFDWPKVLATFATILFLIRSWNRSLKGFLARTSGDYLSAASSENYSIDRAFVRRSPAIKILNESIYDHPKYYDLVFGADCAAEVKFILGCGERYLGRQPQRLFEPACGTGRLLFALARRGYEVGGLDLNPKAVAFCNARFRRHGMPETAKVADMADFRVRRRHDIAFNTINSFRHLGTESAARSHLECVGRAVRADGLYLLGVHLTPTAVAPSETESWSARRGHLSINTHMWTADRDPARRIERFGIRFDVRSPSRSFRIVDELVLRSYTRSQMDRLISRSGCWETIACYDFSYDLEEPLQVDDASEDVVYVLRRR